MGTAKDANSKPKKKSFHAKYGTIDPATGLPPLPERFIIAENGDKDKAIERWRATLAWRDETDADNCLAKPHPKFDAIKANYPSYFHCHDRNNNVVYIERPGTVDIPRIKRNGVGLVELLWHYMYCIEYLWQIFKPKESDRLTTILDLEGVSIMMIAGDVRKFIKMSIAMTSGHYPARGHKLFIINSPYWFGQVWTWIKPLLNPMIEEKLLICTKGAVQIEKLLSIIDEENLPECYGGANKTKFGESDMDLELRGHVLKVLNDSGIQMAEIVA